METSVVLVFAVYGLALFGWGALCFIVGKFVLWPFVKGLNEWLNGGMDEGEVYEAEQLSTMNNFRAEISLITHEVNQQRSLLTENLMMIQKNLKADNDAISEVYKRLSHMEDAAIKGLHERLLKVEEYVAAVDESKYKIASRLNQLERQHENLTIQFSTHRESFKLLVEALEASITKKKSLRGKSK